LGSNHDIGLKGGILDFKHIEAMGMSVWLYMWCVRHQTKSTGFIHGGGIVTYELIQQEIAVPTRTLKRWMAKLHRWGYVTVTYLAYKKMRVQVMKSKKFNYRQSSFSENEEFTPRAKNGPSIGPDVALTGAKNGPSNKRSKERYIEPLNQEAPNGAGVVPAATWLEWIAHRNKIRKPLTPHAVDLQLRDLVEWKSKGFDCVEIIERSIKNGWTGLFSPEKGNGSGSRKESASELARRNAKTLGLTH
jgi:hypothetical protein